MDLLEFIGKLFLPSEPSYGFKDPSRIPNDIEDDLRSEILSPSSPTHNDKERTIIHHIPFQHPPPHHHHREDDQEQETLIFHSQIAGGLFEEMESMFRQFFHFEDFQTAIAFPETEGRHETMENDERTLRDKVLNDRPPPIRNPFGGFFIFPGMDSEFLKSPEVEEQNKDIILDGQNIESLQDLLEPPKSQKPSLFNFSSSSSSSVNGAVQTKITKKDNNGNEQVVVTRKIGEQSHSVTTKKFADGREEKHEDFVNMKPDDLNSFDESWLKRKCKI